MGIGQDSYYVLGEIRTEWNSEVSVCEIPNQSIIDDSFNDHT